MTRRTSDDRLVIAAIGEFYLDLLTVDSWINQRSRPQQGAFLLCSLLQEKEERIRDQVQYLADKRGIPFDEMWRQILRGEAERVLPENPPSADEILEEAG